MKFCKTLVFITMPFFLSGCYLSASITKLTPKKAALLVSGSVPPLENVSGGFQYEVTSTSGYKVRQAVGLTLNKQMATTPGGYKVFTNITGRISSQELNP